MASDIDGANVGSHVVKQYFDRQANHWDRHSHCERRKHRQILGVYDLHTGQRVLDVACRTGVLFPWLLAYDPSLLMGIDLSEGMTDIAGG